MSNDRAEVLREVLCKKDWHHQLFDWLLELCSWGRFDEFIHIEKWSNEKVWIKFYTRTYKYSIRAHVSRKKGKKYLSCGVSTRKPRAGEDWTRGNDLPDGKFTKETWRNIVLGIVKYEGVKVAKNQRPEYEIESETTGPDKK